MHVGPLLLPDNRTPLQATSYVQALSNPKTPILIQNCHPYTGTLDRETSGDNINAFLHCGYVLALGTWGCLGMGMEIATLLALLCTGAWLWCCHLPDQTHDGSCNAAVQQAICLLGPSSYVTYKL